MTNNIGWECPRCFKIHSPFSLTCDCPPLTFTSASSHNTMPIINFHLPTTGFGDHKLASVEAMEQMKKLSERNKNLLTDWCNGIRQCDLAKKYNISPTTVRGLIKNNRRLLPHDKRL